MIALPCAARYNSISLFQNGAFVVFRLFLFASRTTTYQIDFFGTEEKMRPMIVWLAYINSSDS